MAEDANPAEPVNPEAPAAPEPAAAAPTQEAMPWYAEFGDGAGYVENKGWSGPRDMLSSYQNLEKLVGAGPDRLLRLPTDAEVEGSEQWDEVFTKLGRPESPDGYQFAYEPEDDGDLINDFKSWAHELGLSQRQAEGLRERFMAKAGQAETQLETQTEEQIQAEDLALRREWGQAYEEQVGLGRQFAQFAGLDAEKLDALQGVMGYGELMRMAAKLGAGLQEHHRPNEAQTMPGKFTPSAAAARIVELRSDPAFMAVYTDGSAPGHMDAVKRMQQLFEQAHPDDTP